MNRLISFILRHWVYLLAIFTLALFLSVTDHFFLFHGGDNADYISLARSLLQGSGYTNINTFPATPHVKYPPVFPALIALCFLVFGENILAVKVMIAFCAALSALGSGRLWKDREDSYLAPLAALLFAASPFLLHYSLDIYSEIPFTALALLTLVFCERALKAERALNCDTALAAIFLLLASFTRSVGMVLAPALALAALFQRPRRASLKRHASQALVMVSPFTAAASVWVIRDHLLARGASRSYFQELLLKDPNLSGSGRIGILEFILRAADNFGYYLERLAVVLWPLTKAPPTRGLSGLGVALLIVALLGFLRAARKRLGAPELYLILYGAVMLSWSFRQDRLLIPLLPLLFYYFLLGLQLMSDRAARLAWPKGAGRAGRAAVISLSLLTLLAQLQTNAGLIRLTRLNSGQEGFAVNPNFRVVALDSGMSRVLAASIYLRERAEPGAVVLARKASLVALASGHPAVGGPFAADPASFLRDLVKHRVQYVVTDEVYRETQQYILPAIKAHPDRFEPVFRVPGSNTIVYRFRLRQ